MQRRKLYYFASKNAFEAQMLGANDEALQRLYDTSIKKSAEVDAERKAGSRISPVYQVTQGDFKTATGRDYDPRNAQDRQVFFDLVSRGASTSSATAGPGEGPAYGSKEFYTMRQRPTNIPKFGTSGAWYDTETGQLARTTPESRERTTQRQSAQDDAIKRQAQEIVRREQERGQFPISPETETETETETDQIQQIKITPDTPQFKGYVVPESEEWNKLSEKEKLFMAANALTRGETAKFMGGRQKTEGGFLGIGGKKVNRFSEDQSGNTPAETAYLNRVSKMLNQMLDKDEQAAKEAREYGPEVETGILQSEMGGGATVNTKSQLPGNVGQYLDRVLGRKFTKFGSAKPEMFSKPQASKMDISNMRIVNAPGNVRPYTGNVDPRFVNPMTQYADVLDPMRDRMLGRQYFTTTSRKPKK